MTAHPEIFAKAQGEVDRVVGTDRLPTFEDRPELPYLECILREVYRWNPASTTGVSHRLIQDDEYNGYHIPAGVCQCQIPSQHNLTCLRRHDNHSESLVCLCDICILFKYFDMFV